MKQRCLSQNWEIKLCEIENCFRCGRGRHRHGANRRYSSRIRSIAYSTLTEAGVHVYHAPLGTPHGRVCSREGRRRLTPRTVEVVLSLISKNVKLCSMTQSVLDEWFQPQQAWIDKKESKAALTEYLDRYDIERNKLFYEVPHPTFQGHFQNWLRLLPDDTVDRVRSASDLDSVLQEIVDEFYDDIKPDINWDNWPSEQTGRSEPTDRHIREVKAKIYQLIVGYLDGDVDFEVVYGDSGGESKDPAMEHPDFLGSVTVERVNKRNCIDILVYEFSSEEQFFSESYGLSSLMLQRIMSSGIEPTVVIRGVAFDYEGTSWGESNPPEHPIHHSTTDHKNRIVFSEVDNPAGHYGSTWGNLDEMNEVDLESDGDGTTHVYSTGIVDWRIATGIQYGSYRRQ